MHGDVKSAIELTSKLYNGLLQHHTEVYFYLCAQQFLELIRQGKFDEAVIYAQQHLGPFMDSEHVFLVQHLKVLLLLTFTNFINEFRSPGLLRAVVLHGAIKISDESFIVCDSAGICCG
jgi:hypothetical protein